MVLELHVWGPAFGLPSIDAECIAAITYCKWLIPFTQWILVADYDASVSPRYDFPLLVDDLNRVAGFSEIVEYLKNRRSESWHLDDRLAPEQQRDSTAFVSFLQSSAGPLIDLSLYISSENYNSTTSSAYTAILPWYLNYTIPPKRRELARSRTSHLGLSSLEATSTGQDGIKNGPGSLGSNFEAAKRDAGIPTQDNALNMGRKAGLQGLLSAPVYAARFRLDTLTNELLGPLSGLLGNEQYLLGGDNPSSLDCVAFGYLALMFYPSLPQAWLQEAMRARFPRLVAYLERIRRDVLGDQDINPADIWAICSGCTDHPGIQERSHRLDLNLPWSPVPSRPFSLTAATAAREVISALPLFSIIFPRRAIIQADTVKVSDRVQSSLPSQLAVATFFTTAGAIVVALAGMAIRHRRSPREGDLIFWALRPRTGLGEAGNILSILGAPMSAGVGGVAM